LLLLSGVTFTVLLLLSRYGCCYQTHAYNNLLRSHADTVYALAVDPCVARNDFATVSFFVCVVFVFFGPIYRPID
jgi:hypothetical protein